MSEPLAPILAELQIPQDALDILAAKGVDDTATLRLCGWPSLLSKYLWSPNGHLFLLLTTGHAAPSISSPFPIQAPSLVSVRLLHIIARVVRVVSLRVRPCLHGNDDPLITQQESPEPQQLVGLCTHLADSLDDLKEAGVKGGHAKKLLARCSLSGVLMFSPLYASHHAATSP